VLRWCVDTVIFAAVVLASVSCRAADLSSFPPPVTVQPNSAPSAVAPQSPPAATLDSIFVFGGTLTDGNMGQSIDAFKVPYETNHIVGGAYDRKFLNIGGGVTVDGEIGLADRFGNGNSVELWGGAHIGARLPVFSALFITPALTLGLSAVTNCIGIECQRELAHNGNALLLFYFSPEVAFTLQHYPNVDVVYQLHHRSGLFGTLGKMKEGTNANVFGARYHF
jgi:hypothetical protein